jgi:ankyrin repeat protein
LAQIYLGLLDDKLTLNDIRSVLEVFRKQGRGSGEDQKVRILAHAYEQAIERINGQKPGLKELAMKVLSWITCAKRQLTSSELQHALATKAGKSEFDQGNLYDVSDMVSVCAGLVTVDENSNIIRLVHYTTQEYFQRTQKCWFPEAETDITETCVTYLSFNTFESGFCATDEEFEKRLQQNPLYDYAARNWGHHVPAAGIKKEYLILEFLESEAKVSGSGQALMASGSYEGYSQRLPKQLRGIHIAAIFGLERIIITLLNVGNDPDPRDTYFHTPLSYAAEYGREAPAKLLLATGKVDADYKDNCSRTPLSYAAENGHEDVVQLLLDTDKVDADCKDNCSRTPLSYAAENGHKAAVQLLLERGKVDVGWKDIVGLAPLSYAAKNGHEAVVHLLLATGKVKADWKDDSGQTPLSHAAENGHATVVKLLLDTGKVDANSEVRGQRKTLALDLEKRPLVLYTVQSEMGQTPLSYAAENGHAAVVNLLSEAGGYGNIGSCWRSCPNPEFSETLALWFAEQCHGIAEQYHGIASALNEMNKYQDDQSSNSDERDNIWYTPISTQCILWFPQRLCPYGLLRISNYAAAPLSYRAPEHDLKQSLSSACDIWALGCLYLEFITWLLCGWEGVDKFAEARMEPEYDGIFHSDLFFRVVESSITGKLAAMVKPKVHSVCIDAHDKPQPSYAS